MPLCPFCYDNIKDRAAAEQNSVVAIQDNYPVTDGHLLIVPKRHIEDYLIPRRDDDTPHPRGGVRGVILEKMSY
jgi:hypothetical protein